DGHIGGAPLESGHHFESQTIQTIQNVFGRTLRLRHLWQGHIGYYIRADRFAAVERKSSITACSCLTYLSGFACARGPERDGGVCDSTTACLDLPFEARGRFTRSACATQHGGGQTNREKVRCIDLEHLRSAPSLPDMQEKLESARYDALPMI